MINLRLFMPSDAVAIEQWPIYPPPFEYMDYALRGGGWIAEYRDKPDTWIYVAERAGSLIALTMLSATAQSEAEFRIALRADMLGQGLGGVIAQKILTIGFDEIGLQRIHLIVRKNNLRATQLYQRLRFSPCGECYKAINNRQTDFLMMEIFQVEFARVMQ